MASPTGVYVNYGRDVSTFPAEVRPKIKTCIEEYHTSIKTILSHIREWTKEPGNSKHKDTLRNVSQILTITTQEQVFASSAESIYNFRNAILGQDIQFFMEHSFEEKGDSPQLFDNVVMMCRTMIRSTGETKKAEIWLCISNMLLQVLQYRSHHTGSKK
jgi:hypothetical protein